MEQTEKTFDHSNFATNLDEGVTNKKNFFIFAFGAHNPTTGKSWCPDCDAAQPYVTEAKKIISSHKSEKEMFFINIPIEKAQRPDYTNNKVMKLTKVPSLIYYQNGKEMCRIIEGDMANQENVSGFIEQAYE